MLCDGWFSGSVLGGCLSKWRTLPPLPPLPLGQLTRSHSWYGKQTWSGMVWKSPPRLFILRGPTAQLPHPPHMAPPLAGVDAVANQRAGRYAGHHSLLHTDQSNRILQPVAQRDRIRNCQLNFGCDARSLLSSSVFRAFLLLLRCVQATVSLCVGQLPFHITSVFLFEEYFLSRSVRTKY